MLDQVGWRFYVFVGVFGDIREMCRVVFRVMPGVVDGMILGGSGHVMHRSAKQQSRGKALGRQCDGYEPNERDFHGPLHAALKHRYAVTLAQHHG